MSSHLCYITMVTFTMSCLLRKGGHLWPESSIMSHSSIRRRSVQVCVTSVMSCPSLNEFKGEITHNVTHMTKFWAGQIWHVSILVTQKYFMTVVLAAGPKPITELPATGQGYVCRSIDNSNKNRGTYQNDDASGYDIGSKSKHLPVV